MKNKAAVLEMAIVLPLGLDPSHSDYELMQRLEKAILRHAGGYEKFSIEIPQLLRQAIDEVIDSSRSKRFTLDELEKTEKTYIGTKVEILLRNHLDIEKGKILDLSIDGIEVDVKNTIGTNWTIPNEALGHPCILIKANEKSSQCSFGIIVIREEILNKGRNRDQKTTISISGLANVHWLLRNAPYPKNFWAGLAPDVRRQIMTPRGATERLAMLFRLHQELPISRLLVQALAQQKDYMKRLRKNGGARDLLVREGIALLSGKAHHRLIQKLGLPLCDQDDFISIKPRSTEHVRLLQEAGELG